MPRTHYLQSSFSAGVLDPRLASRTDLRQYYQGMSVGTNVVVVPLGGVKRRPGLKYVMELPPQLSRVASGITPTAPNGGTAANANDANASTFLTTTVNLSTTRPYVVAHYDLGSAKAIRFADVLDITITAGSSVREFGIEYSTDDVNWLVFDSPIAGIGGFELVDQDVRSFRRGNPASSTTARYWRVARESAVDLGAAHVQISGFNLYEAGAVSDGVLHEFERSEDERYVIALTDRNALIASNGLLVALIPTDYTSADLRDIDAAQSQDTVVLTHEDFAPQRLTRESSLNWQLSTIPLTGVPDFDYDDALSPVPVSEVQTIAFTGFVEGNTFQVELNGARSGPIAYTPTSTATTAENLRRAIQALYTVGFSGVSVVFTAGTTYTVTWAEDSADNYDLMIGTTLTGTGTIAVAASANGTARREPVWSSTRGYPRTCSFHEGRLWFGGTRSLPQGYFGSVVNDFYNFDVGQGLDDDAVFGMLNTTQLNAITALKSGRFMQVFTTGGEFRFTASPITPSDTPRNQTEYGTAKIHPVASDGATIFVQRTRKVVRDFLFRYEEDAFSSVPLSVLAQHLITNIVDIAAWQGSTSDDANYVFIVNGDGTLAVLNTLRSQEITAFSSWTTDGLFKAAGVSGVDRYFITQRSLNSVDKLILELADEDYYTDCSIKATPLGGYFTPLIGESVRVLADGFVLTTVTVNGFGNVVIVDPYTPVSIIEAGLNWVPTVTTMPLNSDFGNGGNYLRKKRIVKARGNFYRSLGVLYNGRPLADTFFDLDNFDEAPEPYTGIHSLEETSNWDEGTLTQTFSQVDPLPFHLLGIDLEVESS